MISVLVVDDHEQVLRATTRALERHGLICQTARNLTEAVARAREEPPCAVLLDLSLGDESGFDLHAALRAAGETDPAIIFVTSRRDQFFHTLPVLGPSDDWIIKPWDPAELIARVHLALRRTQRSAEGSARAPAAYAPVRPRLTSFTRARRHSLQRLGWPGGHSKSHSPIQRQAYLPADRVRRGVVGLRERGGACGFGAQYAPGRCSRAPPPSRSPRRWCGARIDQPVSYTLASHQVRPQNTIAPTCAPASLRIVKTRVVSEDAAAT